MLKNYFSLLITLLLIIATALFTHAQNPIVKNKGLNDPHIHIFNDTAYVYASHDKSIKSNSFSMDNWWVWSSPDLVNWTHRSTLKPEDTYIGKPFSQCWATDAAKKNGKYYFYFSEGNQQSGVVVGDTPIGPWTDVLKKPLLDSALTPSDEYDMAVFEDEGQAYIIFGVWDYYIAKLNDDMISLAEKPRKITINNPRGPYNLEGKNKEKPTDDKPFMHKYNGKYYLSWGAFYGIADKPYGPFDCKGAIMNQESFAPGFDKPTWPTGFLQGRHGSFFEWNNQSYFAYCDISQTGNRYFRDTFISYVHYKDNGEIAPIRVDGIGVGNYDSNAGKIEAEDYFKAFGAEVKQNGNGFVVQTTAEMSYLNFPNCKGLKEKTKIIFKASAKQNRTFTIELRKNSVFGELLSNYKIEQNSNGTLSDYSFDFPKLNDKENLFFVIQGEKGVTLDSFISSNPQAENLFTL